MTPHLWYEDDDPDDPAKEITELDIWLAIEEMDIKKFGDIEARPSSFEIRKTKISSCELAALTQSFKREYIVQQYRGDKEIKFNFKNKVQVIKPFDWVISGGYSGRVMRINRYKGLRRSSRYWYVWGHTHPWTHSTLLKPFRSDFDVDVGPSDGDILSFSPFPGKQWEYIVFSPEFKSCYKMCRYDCDGKIEYFDQYVDYVCI